LTRAVEVKDLARLGREWSKALDPQPAGLAPLAHHDLFSRWRANRPQEETNDRGVVKRSHGWMDQQPQARLAQLLVLLEQLVVCRAAAEAARQHLLEHTDDIGVEERHTASGEFLVTADGSQVGGPAELLEGAATGSLLD
jgi:hypothetical protein